MAQMLLSVFFYLRKSHIFKGFMGISTEVVRAEFRQSSGTYQLRAGLLNDSSVLMNTKLVQYQRFPSLYGVGLADCVFTPK
jgi:hypothetical protein